MLAGQADADFCHDELPLRGLAAARIGVVAVPDRVHLVHGDRLGPLVPSPRCGCVLDHSCHIPITQRVRAQKADRVLVRAR